MNHKIDRVALAAIVRDLQGISSEDKAALLELIRDHKKYGLVWENKPENVEERLRDEIPILREVKECAIFSDDPDSPNHIIIEGDNYEALTTLSYTHEGRIDVIYIDPPYNTGNKDFIYNDCYVDAEDEYRHSKWLSFMNKRLKLAKRLLKEDGFICISIDDNEYPNLKILCDEVFREQNYLTTFHIQVRYADKSINEEKPFKPLMEYILIYAKDAKVFSPRRESVDYGLEKFCYIIKEKSEGEHFSVGNQEVIVFKNGEWEIEKIENGSLNGLKETWITGSIYTTMSYGKVFQTVVEPRVSKDGVGCLYKVLGRGDDGLGYRYYTGPAKKNASKGKMFSGMPLDKVEQFKSGDIPQRRLPILTMYDFAPDFGNIRSEGGVPFGSGKKPIKMIKQLINYHPSKQAIVLDFFAGSGSTGHAVMDLNEMDGGTRKFIMVTNNENNICEEKTFIRCKNVILGYGSNSGLISNTLHYYKTDFLSRDRSMSNMRQLVNASTDLLCIKEDLYSEQNKFGRWKIPSQIARYFSDGQKHMLIVYDERLVEQLPKMINEIDFGKERIKIYIFSPSRYAFDDEFYEVQDKVQLVALPAAIYDAYSKVLPKRKPKLLDVEEEKEMKEEITLDDLFDLPEEAE
jgi:adenine-specific DNA-methyltransferase